MSQYPEFITDKVRKEFEGTPIEELKTPAEVEEFINRSGTKAIYINSMCGCAAGVARGGFLESLSNKTAPEHFATIFAGVDIEATETLKQYFLPPYKFSSPSIAIFRDQKFSAHVERNDIKMFEPIQFYEYLISLYDHYTGDEIDTNVAIKDPKDNFSITFEKLNSLMGSSEEPLLIDCRPSEYREEFNPFEKSLVLDSDLVDQMLGSPEKFNTPIVFFCVRGVRSMDAIHYFRQNGYTQIKSLVGGVGLQ